MALRTYLTGIADAIREKKGTTDPINAQDFASEIASISTGGGGTGDNPLQALVTGRGAKGGYYLCAQYGGTDLSFLNGIDFSGTTDMTYMFFSARNITTIPNINTSTVTNMSYMFHNCTKLSRIDQLDTTNVTQFSSLFQGCAELTYVCPLNTSKSGNYMSYMFATCKHLETIDITKFVNNSTYFADHCSSLKNFFIRTMDTIPSYGTNMFSACYHMLGTYDMTYNPEGFQDGRVYVPDDKVDTLKAATGWSAFADIIAPISSYPAVQYNSPILQKFSNLYLGQTTIDDIKWWYPSVTTSSMGTLQFQCNEDMTDKTLKFEIQIGMDFNDDLRFSKLDAPDITKDQCELYLTSTSAGTYTVEYTNIPAGIHTIKFVLPETTSSSPRYNQVKFRRIYPED